VGKPNFIPRIGPIKIKIPNAKSICINALRIEEMGNTIRGNPELSMRDLLLRMLWEAARIAVCVNLKGTKARRRCRAKLGVRVLKMTEKTRR
jgi:hypothetical protein